MADTEKIKLAIKSVKFADADSGSGNSKEAFSGEPVKFGVEFNRPLETGETVQVKCLFFRKNPGETNYTQIPWNCLLFTLNEKKKEFEIKFPDNHTGTTLACSFFLYTSPYAPTPGAEQKTVRYVDLKSREGVLIKDVHWSEKELVEFGKITSSRKEIAKNEDGFLHIHTRGMFGRKVTVKLCEADNTNIGGAKYLLLSKDTQIIKDNVLCVYFPMSEVFAKLGWKRNLLLEGGDLELYAVVESEGVADKSSAVMKLNFLRKADKPAVSTVNGTQKFVIGKVEDSERKKNCGGKYCITKSNYKEKKAEKLVQEINIRLAGFGGCLPDDKFTDLTEKCIKQFQRDYMKVPETGKICGNVLKSLDDLEKKYVIKFEDIKCSCGTCNGFGNEKYSNEYNVSNIAERNRKYEYPGIHRSLIWALKAVMFYMENTEKSLSYSVNCIYSGYRCWGDNAIHKRSSTNHMGKALDIHFNKNGKRTQSVANIEEIRKKVFNKYLNAKWDWKKGNEDFFNMESTAKGASTWVHFDVREFSLKYLDKKFFASTLEKTNGENIIELAKKEGLINMCNCLYPVNTNNISQSISKSENDFTEEDAKKALKYIFNNYGKDTAIIIEKMYRLETNHFNSSQYKKCGTGGMEAHGDAPYYGWDKSFFDSHPEYKPVGLYGAFEGKGLSGQGGNAQVTDKKKQFVILPSVEAGMVYKAEYIERHNGNYARWYSTDATAQEKYKESLKGIKSKIVDQF